MKGGYSNTISSTMRFKDGISWTQHCRHCHQTHFYKGQERNVLGVKAAYTVTSVKAVPTGISVLTVHEKCAAAK